MSIRSGILAVLSLGPAYGSQVHAEIEARTERSGHINVGQIYSTLERLQARGSVRPHGVTDDGLPLYALTPSGRDEVASWMLEADADGSWTEFVGHVLMVVSLPGAPARTLLASYRRRFAPPPQHSADSSPSLTAIASAQLGEAALRWLDAVESALEQPDGLARPLREIRPRRGRRPRSDAP